MSERSSRCLSSPLAVPKPSDGGGWRLSVVLIALAVALPLLAACGGESADVDPLEQIISRDAFVSAYVDLRMAALRNPDAAIASSERERILESHGITGDDLLRFVEVHSRDAPRLMQEIWAEVQDRIRQAREEAALEQEPPGSSENDSRK